MQDYLVQAELPPMPHRRDWGSAVKSLSMLGNNLVGNCVLVACMHLWQCITANVGKEKIFTEQEAIDAYTAAAGYVPGDPLTDNGTDTVTALNLWRRTGFAGTQIEAWADVGLGKAISMLQGINIFGGVLVGLALPETALYQVNNGLPWDVANIKGHSPEPASWGYHEVDTSTYDTLGMPVRTWGAVQKMTWRFWDRYADENRVVLVKDWYSINGSTPSGVLMKGLRADMLALST
jgi:hypothetical protein